ncbi:MAG: hypothetical protein JSR92_19635, partial [Proteobacteria bacterium]|nr:hypothetical protein [Pseudomonadota bacterium]
GRAAHGRGRRHALAHPRRRRPPRHQRAAVSRRRDAGAVRRHHRAHPDGGGQRRQHGPVVAAPLHAGRVPPAPAVGAPLPAPHPARLRPHAAPRPARAAGAPDRGLSGARLSGPAPRGSARACMGKYPVWRAARARAPHP